MKRYFLYACMALLGVGPASSQTTVTTTGGTANNISKFSSSSTIVNSAITENNGSVGIGTSNPQSFLDIHGNSGVTFAIGVEGENVLLFGTQGSPTMGGSLTSSAGFSSCYNGVFLNSNGTGRGDVGSQRNTTLPSWRMSLGSGDCEWAGEESFAIGRVSAGGNYLAPSILFMIDATGKAHTGGGIVFPDGTQQTTAQLIGPQGATGPQGTTGPQGAVGPQGATGPQGPPGPGSTSSVCTTRSGVPAADCSCAIRLVTKTLAPTVSPGSSSCTATSNTGTCSANGGATFSGACCVCAPN